MDLATIFSKGGGVLYLLFAISIYMVAAIIYKAFQFYSSGVFNTRIIDSVMDDVKKGELTTAEYKLQHAFGPVPMIMKVAIACVTNRHMSQKSRESEISRVGTAEMRRLESHMRGLELISTTAPLLGLLGTVMGMVRAFARLAEAGSRVDPAMLADGIWEALITTVGGLMLAIPAMIAYYILDGIVEKVRASMRDVTIQILALEDEFMRNEKEQERRREMELDRELREIRDAQERAIAAAAEHTRSTPQSSSTLRMLSPSYTRF